MSFIIILAIGAAAALLLGIYINSNWTSIPPALQVQDKKTVITIAMIVAALLAMIFWQLCLVVVAGFIIYLYIYKKYIKK